MAWPIPHWLVVVLALSIVGCGSNDDITSVQTRDVFSPPNGGINRTAIVVPKGRAVAFIVQPLNGVETLKQDVLLESQNPTVATVAPTDTMNHFVAMGIEEGLALVDLVGESGRVSSVQFTVEVVAP